MPWHVAALFTTTQSKSANVAPLFLRDYVFNGLPTGIPTILFSHERVSVDF